jgi:hypothetical protein
LADLAKIVVATLKAPVLAREREKEAPVDSARKKERKKERTKERKKERTKEIQKERDRHLHIS